MPPMAPPISNYPQNQHFGRNDLESYHSVPAWNTAPRNPSFSNDSYGFGLDKLRNEFIRYKPQPNYEYRSPPGYPMDYGQKSMPGISDAELFNLLGRYPGL